MKNLFVLIMAFAFSCWAITKPMESIENYNVLLLHGAYGKDQGFEGDSTLKEASSIGHYLGDATLGAYHSGDRLTNWIATNVFEENVHGNDDEYVHESYIYHWRAFSNPANSSINNARELGYRQWNGGNKYGKRRALVEEAQEVKAVFHNSGTGRNDSGQVALDSIRKYPDLYRQLASRYILVGHSMGGVVSREWIQNSDYYHGEVDKVITLDSPHEGTGALNMQLDLVDIPQLGLESITESVLMIAGVGLTMYMRGKDLGAVTTGLLGLGISTGLSLVNFVFGGITYLAFLEDYSRSDSLVCYVDPHADENDDCTFHPNITALKSLYNAPDSLPMFRLMAGENSMTFTDPKLGYKKLLSFFVPDGLTVPFANLAAQWTSGFPMNFSDFGSFFTEYRRAVVTSYVNAVTGLGAGVFGGVHLQERGSALVETNAGLGYGTTMLIHPDVDVKRFKFNAAYYASEAAVTHVAEGLFVVGAAALVLDLLGTFGDAAKSALGIAAAIGLGSSVATSFTSGLLDLGKSHMYPLFKDHLNTWKKKDENTYSKVDGSNGKEQPYIMEDFLYERPFVNLALNDSRTMGMLAQDTSLNPNCYFESDSLKKVPLCEVGLYGSRDSIVIDPVTMKETPVYNAAVVKTDSAGNVVLDSLGNVLYDSVYYGSFEQRNYSEFRKSPLKFKSESDWYKVGVKVDRWERVDGLKPNGDLAPKGVPIRHVERYNVPDIVATGFIEKYSFVVDDLMPHRMRQIKMTFNSNEEVAWECDISKAEDDPHACAVYKRLLGNSWGSPDTTIGDKGYVPHPIKKNCRFDFDARKYFGNLASIQKDNQNTVVISMVNKIGLSNTQRFYYLFKATDNMLKPTWPQHDVVLNAIDGFRAYVSALDYQGFRVHGASDEFFRDSLDNYVVRFGSLDMGTATVIGNNGSEYVFASKRKDLDPAEGEYRWVVSTNINNKDLKKPSEPDSSKTDSYEVHFTVDRTAPAFTLTSDAMMNPDCSMFITRFKWAGKDSADKANGSDIRAMLV